MGVRAWQQPRQGGSISFSICFLGGREPFKYERQTVMTWDNRERERIIEQALSAYTHTEVTQATQKLRRWMQDHPQDAGIVDTFEVLSHKQDFAEKHERSIAEPTGASPAGRAA